jgi:replicative DNA helicase
MQRAETGYRQPPFDETAERAVLGSVFFDNESIDRVTHLLRPTDFFRLAHELVFAAMLSLAKRGEGIDLVTVANQLRGEGNLEKAGSEAALADLSGLVGTSANIVYYAKIVADLKRAREVIRLCGEAVDEAYNAGRDVEHEAVGALIEKVSADLFAVSADGQRGGELRTMRQAVEALWQRFDALHDDDASVNGVPGSLPKLNAKLGGGYGRSNLIILAARPGVGKTALVLNEVVAVAKRAMRVRVPDWTGDPDAPEAWTTRRAIAAMFSLEMAEDELMLRVAASEGHLDLYRLREPKHMRETDWHKLSPVLTGTESLGLYIDDSSDQTVDSIRAKARRLRAEHGYLDMIAVDYLQLMRSPKKVEARHLEIGDITRGLKGLAKDLQCPVLALSQLSRKAEETNEPPSLRHLRESGSIEQDADVVLFIHPTGERRENEAVVADIIIAKNRQGSIGTVPVVFNGATMTFRERETIERD